MNIYFKCASGVLITLILYIVLSKSNKDFAYILSIAAGACILLYVLGSLSPVFDFFAQLQKVSNLDSDMLGIVLKSVGIGILTEIISSICSDAGNSALAKTLYIVAGAVILLMSIPLLEAFIVLVEEILIAL